MICNTISLRNDFFFKFILNSCSNNCYYFLIVQNSFHMDNCLAFLYMETSSFVGEGLPNLSLTSALLTYEKEGIFIVPHHALVLSSLIQRNAPFSCLFKIRECNRGPALARIPLEDHNYYLWIIIYYMYFVSECYSTWFKSDPLIQSQSCMSTLPIRAEHRI